MTNVFQEIYVTLREAGAQHASTEEAARRIRLSNQTSFALLLMGLAFFIITLYLYPQLSWVPFIGCLSYAATPLLNHLKIPDVARFQLSAVVPFIVIVYHGYLMQPKEDIIAGLFVLQASFLVVPWVVIGLKEPVSLVAAFAMITGYLFLTPLSNDFFVMPLDNNTFREGFMAYGSLATGIVLICISMYYLLSYQMHSQSKMIKLISEEEQADWAMSLKEKEMDSYLEKMEQRREIEKEQDWIIEGISKVHEVQQRYQDSEERLFDELLAMLMNYMEAVEGMLFITTAESNEEPYMSLKSARAGGRKRILDQKYITKGMGLTGQAFTDGQRRVLTNLPRGYTFMSVEAGRAKPNCVLIQPLTDDQNNVMGLIELAFMKEPEKYKLEFMVQISKDMAGSLSYVENSIRTRKLLEDSQMLTEQMQAQEEEMRQNMEEMAATQEEMTRKQMHYQTEIQQLKNLIEEQQLA